MDATLAPVSIADLRAKGVMLTAGEVLAIVQSLMSAAADSRAQPPFGPLSLENIVIATDGSVASLASAVTPTVLEVAILVQELLPQGTPEVPGALRFTIGRALHEVVAPPFDSLTEFSDALRRFETGDRVAVVRALFARARSTCGPLRVVQRRRLLPVATVLVAGLVLIGAGELMRHSAVVGLQPTTASSRSTGVRPPPTIAGAPTDVGSSAGARPDKVAPPVPPPRRVAKPQQRSVKAATSKNAARMRPALPSRILARIRIQVDEL